MQSCTLDLYTDYLLSSTGATMATGLSRLLEGALSHDHITRWLSTRLARLRYGGRPSP